MLAAGEIGDEDDDEQAEPAGASSAPHPDPEQPAPQLAGLVGWARVAALSATQPRVDVRPEFRLWPEHLPAFALWCAVQTQWRTSMAGPTGLDWQGVRAHPAARALPRAQREPVLADLACMEVAWLAHRAHLARLREQHPAEPTGLGS